jgi:NAD dependent epimerase/dehydratase family enzyme
MSCFAAASPWRKRPPKQAQPRRRPLKQALPRKRQLKQKPPRNRILLAGRWSSGEQWISWIHEGDLARCVLFFIANNHISGPINVTAPNPVRNREMMQLLSKMVHKNYQVRMIPEFLLRLMTGEFASVFVNGQRVIPHKLLHQGFIFDYPNLSDALNMLVNFRNNNRQDAYFS